MQRWMIIEWMTCDKSALLHNWPWPLSLPLFDKHIWWSVIYGSSNVSWHTNNTDKDMKSGNSCLVWHWHDCTIAEVLCDTKDSRRCYRAALLSVYKCSAAFHSNFNKMNGNPSEKFIDNWKRKWIKCWWFEWVALYHSNPSIFHCLHRQVSESASNFGPIFLYF